MLMLHRCSTTLLTLTHYCHTASLLKATRVLHKPMALAVALFVLAAATTNAVVVVSRSPAYYPRLLALNATAAIGVLEKPSGGTRRLVSVLRGSHGTWSDYGVVIEDSDSTADVANGHVVLMPNGEVLAAYRHHNGAGANRVFRIQVSASSDSGRTWALRSTVEQGPTGLWEPFLFLASTSTTQTLRAFYAAELTNGGEQDVVGRSSLDGGHTWSGVDVRLHTANARNGMPGVAALPPLPGHSDPRAVLVMERPVRGSSGGGGFTNFTVWSAISVDGGSSWAEPALVHAPAAPHFNSGSPQVAQCPPDGSGGVRVAAVYMSDELGAGGAWPDRARVWVSYGSLAVDEQSFTWDNGTALPSATASIYWPSLLVDGPATRRVVYQGSDGTAYVSDDDGVTNLCS